MSRRLLVGCVLVRYSLWLSAPTKPLAHIAWAMLSLRCNRLVNRWPNKRSKIWMLPAGPKLFQSMPLEATPRQRFLLSSKTCDINRKASSEVNPARAASRYSYIFAVWKSMSLTIPAESKALPADVGGNCHTDGSRTNAQSSRALCKGPGLCGLFKLHLSWFVRQGCLPISLTGTFKKAKGRSKVRKPVASSSGGVHVRHRLELCINSNSRNQIIFALSSMHC